MTPTKILFLDIDGVLNSNRSSLALGGRPHCFSAADMKRFDHVAIGLIRKLCKETGCAIVLSSDWRLDHSAQETASALDLPVIDVTPRLPGTRGFEINAWLNAHPEVTRFAIVDDIPQMFDVHERNFVLTDDGFGLSLSNYRELRGILMDVQSGEKGGMTNDRELLELAAQAAGMHVLPEGEPWPIEDIGWFFNQVGDNPPALYNRASKVLEMWAPLTDDGDNRRLQVALHINVRFVWCGMNDQYDEVCAESGRICKYQQIGHGFDELAATRRAVVRAAAAMAKGRNSNGS